MRRKRYQAPLLETVRMEVNGSCMLVDWSADKGGEDDNNGNTPEARGAITFEEEEENNSGFPLWEW